MIKPEMRGAETEKNHLMQAMAASIAANMNFARFRVLPVGREMEVAEAMALFSCFEEEVVEAGRVLYEAGSRSERVMRLILNGSAAVRDASGNVYATLKPGDVFGLFSFLDERPHSATVMAREELTTLTLRRSFFDVITLEDPVLGHQLLRFMFRLLSRMALNLEVEYAALRDYALGVRP